ncbi:MAG: cell division protein FtsA [Gemmatimonadetes bacterium]|nr:cell division protein FtsA [Gemmatimonadota bacterium]
MSAAPTKLVAALDLGSTKVTAVVAEAGGDARRPTARVLGVGIERSNGIRRGVVRDIEEATRAITKALSDAQRMAGMEVGSVYCGIAGEHVAGKSSQGVVSVTGEEIRTGDLARVNDVACTVSLGRDHELLHAIPQEYRVDQQTGISEPLGMSGSRLEAEVYLVTVYSNALQNLKKCVERAGYHVEEFVLEPLAASLPVLTADELELGCALIDLGGGSTNVAVFQGGKIRHTGSVRIAGGHVTNDIVHGLQVTQSDAGCPPAGGAGVRAGRDHPRRIPEPAPGGDRAGGGRCLDAGDHRAGARGVRDAGAGRPGGPGAHRAGRRCRGPADGGGGGAGALRGAQARRRAGLRDGRATGTARREVAGPGEAVVPGLLLGDAGATHDLRAR